MQTRGEGVQNPENFADVICKCPRRTRSEGKALFSSILDSRNVVTVVVQRARSAFHYATHATTTTKKLHTFFPERRMAMEEEEGKK